MKKPDLLRAALAAADPDLARNPDGLILWADQGSVASPMTPSFSFAYTYRLHGLLLNYGGHQAVLTIAILAWLRVQQPDMLQPNKPAFTFEVDFMDNKTVDLEFYLDLTEQVRAVQREDGGFDMEFLTEPDPLFTDDLGVGGVVPIPPLSSIWFNGERLVPDAPLP